MRINAQINQMIKQYLEYNLTEYLKLLPCENLEAALGHLMSNDIIEPHIIGIYGAIKNELEYRDSDAKLAVKIKKI